MTELSQIRPDRQVSVREVFGIDSDLMVPAFADATTTCRRSTRSIASIPR
jgi:hypothetical protein